MMTTGGDDRISELSDDLLRRILHFLPSKNAASTSVLSRRWGSLWPSCGAVKLAAQVRGYDHLWQSGSDAAYQEAEDAFFKKQEDLVHGARAAVDAAEVPVTRLTLRVEFSKHGGGESSISEFLSRTRDGHPLDVVGAVVSHRAARRAEELCVAAVDASSIYVYYEQESYWQDRIYGLASLPSSETLRVLDLTGCDLTLTRLSSSSPALMATLPLPRLATLRLRFCPVERELLQALLDAAPELTTVQLESLFFEAPHNYDGAATTAAEPPVLRLSFQAATTLVLALCGMEVQVQDSQDGRGRSTWDIEIDAPRLQSFKYKGLMRRFVLRSAAPGVARVDLHFLRQEQNRHNPDDKEEETTQMLFWQFLHNFTNARTLKLKVGNDLKDIAAIGKALRARLLCAFPRVERLELEGVHHPRSKTAAVAIANLLHCCPVLGEIVLKLSTASPLLKDSRYGREFLERKDRSDYTKSMDRFLRRRKSNTAMSVWDSSVGDNKYGDVPCIPGLSGRSFACLERTLTRVGLQFRLESNSISSCLGLRLIKFFADHARVLEQMSVDTGNRRLDEHLNFNVETVMALAPTPISATASFQHVNLAESLSEFSRISSASHDSIIDLAKSTVGFTMLPLQRQERI